MWWMWHADVGHWVLNKTPGQGLKINYYIFIYMKNIFIFYCISDPA